MKCRRELVACVERCVAIVLVVRGRQCAFLFRSGQLSRVADGQPWSKECYVMLEDCSTTCHRRVTPVRWPAAVVWSVVNAVSLSSGSVQHRHVVLVNLSPLLCSPCSKARPAFPDYSACRHRCRVFCRRRVCCRDWTDQSVVSVESPVDGVF